MKETNEPVAARVTTAIVSQYRLVSGAVPTEVSLSHGFVVGSSDATATMVSRPRPLSAANETRQPKCWPSQVPAGTPSRAASELPANIRPTARPRTLAGNIPAALDTTTAQNTAWLSAVATRVASSRS